MKRHKNKLLTLVLICTVAVIFTKCIDEQKQTNDPRGNAYIGSAKCVSCHKTIFESYITTAHNTSTSTASAHSIAGSFSKDSNEYYYRSAVKVTMEQRDSGFYQVAYMNDVQKQAERFDIVVGSGRKAQTYLYWLEDKIYQLPVSYYVSAKSWVNSPNYPAKQVRYDRNIPVGCFECHGSYIKRTSVEPAGNRLIDHFDKNQLVYGIDCERCHGPASEHVSFHEQHPEEKKPKYITAAAGLPRQQKLDMCSICHSGIRQTKKSTFFFTPAAKISDFLVPDTSVVSTSDIDVHGKQYQLLAASQCFIKSNSLNCSSCHNTHLKERDDMALFSKRCMNCHNDAGHNFCTMIPKNGIKLESNCIDCHMPAKASKVITLRSQGQVNPTPDLVRTHYIAVYPEEAKKFIEAKRR